MKHTKGPWQIYTYKNGAIRINNGAATIADIAGDKYESLKDACLIAAAPEMLGLLKAILSQMEYELPKAVKVYTNGESGLFGMRHLLKKIITKAEGSEE